MPRFAIAVAIAAFVSVYASAEVPFEEVVINPNAGTGLAITVADVNKDGLKDIIGVSSDDVAWYENPSWDRHLMADTIKNSNVCVAANDINGDGIPEFALGADWQFNNTADGGALYLLKAKEDVTAPWEVIPLLEQEPTLHRIRWADTDGDGVRELVVAPLKGQGSTAPYFQNAAARLFLLRPSADDPFVPYSWKEEIINDTDLHVVHNIWPTPIVDAGKDALLAASYEGVSRFVREGNGQWRREVLTEGNPDQMPNSGAGEIKVSFTAAPMLATVEPWHGTKAVVYTRSDNTWQRHEIDDTLAGGHAVAWADFDGDLADELLVGYRENGSSGKPGLNIYWLSDSEDGSVSAVKQIVDDGGMATEDAVATDITGNGNPDIVAFGRATHNIKLYVNMAPEFETDIQPEADHGAGN